MSYKDYLLGKDNELLNKFDEDKLYDPEYVEFTTRGENVVPSKTKCMRCGTVIVDYQDQDDLQAIRMSQAPKNYKTIRRNLTNGSYLNILVCPSCEHEPIDDERAMAVVRAGLAREAELIGKDPEFIKKRAQHYNTLKFQEED